MRFFISAGEASGDIHAARLIGALRELDPGAAFMFLGGDEMERAAGVRPIVHYSRMAYMGFLSVARHLPDILAIMESARKALSVFRPDAVILVDYPSFNMRLAAEARRLGIPVFYYIAPKVWAWKKWRVRSIARLVDHVYSILPFEPEFFSAEGFDRVTYVGNPSVEEVDARIAASPERSDYFSRLGVDSTRPVVALLPGSRIGEIRANLPVMLRAVPPGCSAVIAAAPSVPGSLYRGLGSGEIPLVAGDSVQLMRLATVAAVTSGTATLECALTGTPQVVCYRANGSRLTYSLMRRLIHVDFVSLPNLIAGRRIVPELLLHNCTPEWVGAELASLIPAGSQARLDQIAGYREMRRRLGDSPAALTAARALLKALAR